VRHRQLQQLLFSDRERRRPSIRRRHQRHVHFGTDLQPRSQSAAKRLDGSRRRHLDEATRSIGSARRRRRRVVNLKAEYGIDTDGDRRPDTWTTVAPADWTTVLAVRTGLLVRSKQFEESIDPQYCPAVTPGASRAGPTAPGRTGS
jgi:hypothetical protein